MQRFKLDYAIDRPFVSLTIASSLDTLEVANLKNRWKIELSFIWMKQHFNIYIHWDKTESAASLPNLRRDTAYWMVAIIQHKTNAELNIYDGLEAVSKVLTDDKRHFTTLFATLTTILTIYFMNRED